MLGDYALEVRARFIEVLAGMGINRRLAVNGKPATSGLRGEGMQS
jgi:hypothetical protein